MPTDDIIEHFTVRVWSETQNGLQQNHKRGHISLELHDGTYISIFRSANGVEKCPDVKQDIARLGRDSDVTMRLLVEDHMRHPERIKTWVESYKNGEIIFDPMDTCCSVVYGLLVRSGCPSMEIEPFKMRVADMKDYLYAILRYAKKPRNQRASSSGDSSS